MEQALDSSGGLPTARRPFKENPWRVANGSEYQALLLRRQFELHCLYLVQLPQTSLRAQSGLRIDRAANDTHPILAQQRPRANPKSAAH
jgi:hypothetical protein